MATRGRPPLGDAKKVGITIYVDPLMKFEVLSFAEAQGLTLQDLVRRYVSDGYLRDKATLCGRQEPTAPSDPGAIIV
jgi:hypothetical protein